jgi:hypothetical protein
MSGNTDNTVIVERPPEFFAYPPLLLDDSIRLVLLCRAPKVEDELHIKLVHATLSTITGSSTDENSYTALSYFWGPQDIRKTVHIGSDFLEIGQNLYDALCHLRQQAKDILVWADGVCIDQQNLKERNHQVHYMRDIYSKASKTVVYLGEDQGNTCLSAWNFLERESSDPELQAGHQSDIEFRGDLNDVENDVLTRPWFSRVWVLQEVVVSTNVLVQCGTRCVTWDDFCKVILLEPRLNDRYGTSLRRSYLVKNVRDMFQARATFLQTHKLTHLLPPWFSSIKNSSATSDNILDMLMGARHLNATDSRDKIFALLGITSGTKGDAKMLEIDYGKPMPAVYADFAKYMISSTSSYDILSHVTGERLGKNYYGSRILVPSWVPD